MYTLLLLSSWAEKTLSYMQIYPKCVSDKSVFHLSKHGVDNVFGKRVRVQCAAVGPDKPHAASTAWPEGVLEQQSSDNFMVNSENSEWQELQGVLSAQLPSHPKLFRGQLENGLRYLILPNKVPQNRFEAHMEIHAGSIDEDDDEQGIAHMIEHVAFLGSKKREKLLRTSACLNAYTEFHHTVFHIHSPTSMQVCNCRFHLFSLIIVHRRRTQLAISNNDEDESI
ncbi:putative processing peptidase [Helianthus annuus]|nr:putative processing peptidase [Helianthus annuus]KAJ0892007.1 putative processing peptidase [Helianthus annuus]